MRSTEPVIEALPLGRDAMRIVNQRANALAHEAFVRLREQLRMRACEAICAGVDVQSRLAALHIAEVHLTGDGDVFLNPPIGTPGAHRQEGNSAPARALVAGPGESPAFSPVERV